MSSLKPDSKLGQYTIVRLVGRGGMGEVYEAFDHSLDRRIALKVILPKKSKGDTHVIMIQRFLQEARMLAQVNHPNVVTIYEINRVDDVEYIAMEFVDGAQLSDLFKLFAFSADEAITMFFQMLKGIKALHDKQILHRDIKPQNIMIRPDGQLKILDFGIAKRASDEPPDEANKLVGTLAYLPPEVIRGQRADVKSDIWSLGAIFYECLVGHPLVGAEGRSISGMAIDPKSEVVFPHECVERVYPEMRMFITRMCHADPAQRLESVAQALEELKQVQKVRKQPTPPLFFTMLNRVIENIEKVKLTVEQEQLGDAQAKREFTQELLLNIPQHHVSFPSFPEIPLGSIPQTITQITQDSIMARQKLRKKMSRRRRKYSWRSYAPLLAISCSIAMIGAWLIYTWVSQQGLVAKTPASEQALESPKPVEVVSTQPAHVQPPLPVSPPEQSLVLENPLPQETLRLEPMIVPTFSWSHTIQEGEFQIVVSTDEVFHSIVLSEGVSGSFYRPIRPLPDGTYYWKLVSLKSKLELGPSPFRIQVLKPIAAAKKVATPKPVNVPSPKISKAKQVFLFKFKTNERTVASTKAIPLEYPTLTWSAVKDANTYRVEFSRDESFAKVFERKIVSEPKLEWKKAYPDEVYWRVTAVTKEGASPPSRIGKLDIRLPAPDLMSSYSYNEHYFFEWDAVAMADKYIIQWSEDKKMSLPNEIITTRAQSPLPIKGAQIYVRIAIANKNGKRVSDFSRVARVTKRSR